ncbi:nucleotidyl transferase AbiEii/AbiGii toxin family protein [Acidithiobacillus thiooxidans]|uniref:nucleotidyl transferase AbiEii/AbiGii toxin family protein n=1 Tax=Acidithiobacillus thiooxidans TaxID=930 RepID=UPI001C075DFA|nr:nucleotidyl transferase AbiEii/AbiGii toxin family protein [Acidithiobacillus thiooxidans]MBU2792801.1 nucleotidyl transferase AbiEii/AbiGii toxin family protein [Acidithiobacillus thiooxidans]
MKELNSNDLDSIQKLAAANILPLPEDMIEKDILVADAVRAICAASNARGARIIFGGGTSLSLAQQVIQRMSEDADFRIILPPDVTNPSQRRSFLSDVKTDILSAMEQTGFPLEGDLTARNGNGYIMGNFGYASAFAHSSALRPHIKLEITAFEPVANIETKPLRTILDRVLDRPVDSTLPMVPVVSIADTLSDKMNCSRQAYTAMA